MNKGYDLSPVDFKIDKDIKQFIERRNKDGSSLIKIKLMEDKYQNHFSSALNLRNQKIKKFIDSLNKSSLFGTHKENLKLLDKVFQANKYSYVNYFKF